MRKLLTLSTTIVAITAAGLTSPVQADSPPGGPIADVLVGGISGTHDVTANLASARLTTTVFGRTSTVPYCSYTTAPGKVGPALLPGYGATNRPGFRFSGLNLECPGFAGAGMGWSFDQCDLNIVMADDNVHTGLNTATSIPDAGSGTTASSVNGTAFLNSPTTGLPCVRVDGGNGCTYKVGGSTNASFDEIKAVAGVNYQELRLTGSGLQVSDKSGAGCGMTNGQSISVDLRFDLFASGPVDFTQAGTPNGAPLAKVVVNGSAASNGHDLVGLLDAGSISPSVYTIPTNLNCSSATAAGEVHGGSAQIDPNTGFSLGNVFTLEDLSLSCASIFPGTTATMTLVDQCDIDVVMGDDNVHTGLDPVNDAVDTGTGPEKSGVDGRAYLTSRSTGQNCLRYSISNGCRFTVGGNIAAGFHEAITTVGGLNYQQLKLAGSTLQIKDPVGCLGAVKNNDQFPLDVVLNVRTPDGTIDLAPDPAA